MNNNNENNVYRNKEIFNLYFINKKCDKVLSRNRTECLVKLPTLQYTKK